MIHYMLPKTAAEVHDEIAISARTRRLAKNITQEDLAEQSGVAIATLRRFENGGAVSLATLLAIAEALGTLDAFSDLFPMPEASSLDELDEFSQLRRRAAKQRTR